MTNFSRSLKGRKVLTPKQRVLKKWPTAYSKEGLMSGKWYIYRPYGGEYIALSCEDTAKLAWEKAAQAV